MRIVGYIVGGLVVLFGLTPLLLGLGIVGYVRDLEPLEIPLQGFAAPPEAVAVVSPEFDVDAADIPSQLADARAFLQLRPAPDSGPLFIGLAASGDVQRYLRNAPIATLEASDTPIATDAAAPEPQVLLRGVQGGVDVDLVLQPGAKRKVAPPATRAFWTRQAEVDGDGRIELSPADLEGDGVRIVVMRQDGRPGIATDAVVRLKVPIVMTAGWILLVIGLLSVGIGALVIVLVAVLGGRSTPPPQPPGAGPTPRPGPGAPAVDTGPPSAA